MTPGRLIRKILIATDGSGPALRAADYAAEIAQCTNAEVTILTAAETSGITQFVTYAVQASENLPEELRHTGAHIVESTKKPFLEADVPVHTKIIEGFAPEVILNEARDGNYDLIAMGSRGAGARLTKRLIFGMGSVAERVVSSAPCPVLVARE